MRHGFIRSRWEPRWRGKVLAGTQSHSPERRMQNVASDPATGQVAANETDRLIASDKVEGTAVYGPEGERLARSTTSWSTSAAAKPNTRSCRSAGSWASATTIFRCLGRR